ncbi:TIGR01440 family protein [Bacillus sp. M6-12]|uniref:TIGR01440 family protein n=1 Tax=Bacillus sp. M6-12 TaxID=2054166 RepID=UPI000C787103|nr:TIGR01440 family protein [Bacillus sp. M6-12]PLS18345.1 TIGR01440 family protein [Bacillus sp. M6-12]
MAFEQSVSSDLEVWRTQLRTLLGDLQDEAQLQDKHLLVVGCSTSEVIGKRIGTEGTLDAAAIIFREFEAFQQKTGLNLAFQCCEHLNRALVVTRQTAESRGYEEVAVIPVQTAGGAMAAYAFNHLNQAVVVEHIKADAGIDIGDTFIGMHLKHVAVPVRSKIRQVGHAHVTMAKTRPKLIGGERAVYDNKPELKSCT